MTTFVTSCGTNVTWPEETRNHGSFRSLGAAWKAPRMTGPGTTKETGR